MTDELEIFQEPPAAGVAESPDEGPSASKGGARRAASLLVVSGAKGGVGKSMLATNLALYLATIGREVVLVDADAGGATLHSMLGVEHPAKLPTYDPPLPTFRVAEPVNVEDEAFGENLVGATPPPRTDPPPAPDSQAEPGARVATGFANLSLIHAGVDQAYAGEAEARTLEDVAARIATLDADYVVLDVGARTDPDALAIIREANIAVYVTLPEPTAIENQYRFVRASFLEGVLASLPQMPREVVRAVAAELGGAPAPLDLCRVLESRGEPAAEAVHEAMTAQRHHFIVNQTRLRADLELGDRVRSAAHRRLGLSFDYLGYIDYDDTVWNCVRSRRPLLAESPGTKASKSIEKIARRLLAIEAGKARRTVRPNVPPNSHHDFLEVDRGATDEEIRRAYKRAKDVYGAEALCRHGLFDDAGLEAVRARLEEAYDVLLDPARRRPYELSVFPPEPEPEERPQVRSDEPLPPAPVITPDTEFTGALLRSVRESQGITLRMVSTRTKIGMNYLESIEADDFDGLPAEVYVRGFVTEVAKTLKLDHEQVSRSYIKRLRIFAEQ